MVELFNFSRGGGVVLFSLCHRLWLVSALGLIVWVALAARRHDYALRAIGLSLMIIELSRVTALYFGGMLDRGFLPLHLCGVAIYLSALHAITENEMIGELIFSTLMPGSVCALLFPDWLSYSPTSIIFLSSFGVHTLLCAYGTAMLSSGSFSPDARRLPRCFLFLIIYAVIIYFVDRLFDVNYLFLINPVKGSPLEWFGTILPWYALGYFPSLFVIWAVIYGVWALAHKKHPPKRQVRSLSKKSI
ncbi:MAG: YwaF family protein [Oscillospiraceae bacterium]